MPLILKKIKKSRLKNRKFASFRKYPYLCKVKRVLPSSGVTRKAYRGANLSVLRYCSSVGLFVTFLCHISVNIFMFLHILIVNE